LTSSTKLAGSHGVALVSVTAQPGGIVLTSGKTATIPATADLSFEVKVQNQGDVTETNVPVVAKLKLPDNGGELTQTGSIATITSTGTQSVTIQGFAIPAEALSKVSTLTVTAGPVKGERTTSNNTATYKILLQLQ